MKIVLAVDNDKQTIIKRTGQAPFFVIYEDDKIVKYIENSHHHGEGHHHPHEHRKDVEPLKDCDIFLVQAIGENMKDAVNSIGLDVKKIRQKDGLTADEVVKNFLAGNI